jgi:hypothetical protein
VALEVVLDGGASRDSRGTCKHRSMTASGATGPLGTRGTNLSIEMCLHVIIEDYVLGDLDTMTTRD